MLKMQKMAEPHSRFLGFRFIVPGFRFMENQSSDQEPGDNDRKTWPTSGHGTHYIGSWFLVPGFWRITLIALRAIYRATHACVIRKPKTRDREPTLAMAPIVGFLGF
jgi:hypothetical protein